MQIGRAGQSKGNADTQNLNMPADAFVHAATNELFVADGYGNRRVIVFDADTGRFKRMWGAFGAAPIDDAPNPAIPDVFAARCVAVRSARARGARLEGRSCVCLGPRRQACAGVRPRRHLSDAGVHRPRVQGAGVRQRDDDGEHGVLGGSGAALPVCGQPEPGEGHGVRSQDAHAASTNSASGDRPRDSSARCTT